MESSATFKCSMQVQTARSKHSAVIQAQKHGKALGDIEHVCKTYALHGKMI